MSAQLGSLRRGADACGDDAAEVACDDDGGAAGNESQLREVLVEPGTYWLFVDGFRGDGQTQIDLE
ncbi:MAG: hypothetical protein KC731_26615, partial [Myxococcales bacterium]|nr:hypothetical protein [Myxococcales bacterium]